MACKDEEVQKSNKSSGKYKGPEDECGRGAGGTEREGVCVCVYKHLEGERASAIWKQGHGKFCNT